MASQVPAQRVWQRARARCEYCQLPQEFDPLPFQIDHIIARKHRGPTCMENLALASFTCNNHKGPNIAGIDLDTHAVMPLFHPRRDDWQEHFVWHGSELVGRTPVGRVLIAVLATNLPRRVALRRALMEEEVFPPPY
jgi:HNH endonuclease